MGPASGSALALGFWKPVARGPGEKAAGILLPVKSPLLGIPRVSCEQGSTTAVPRGSPMRGDAGGTG